MDSSQEIARVVAEQHGSAFEWVTWKDYHPIVLTVLHWLEEQGYLSIVKEQPIE